MSQRTLFVAATPEDEPPKKRRSGHAHHFMESTSIAAFAVSDKQRSRERVLAYFEEVGARGATDAELGRSMRNRFGRTQNTWAPARHYLSKDMTIIRTKEKRKTSARASGYVWILPAYATEQQKRDGRDYWVSRKRFAVADVKNAIAAVEAALATKSPGFSMDPAAVIGALELLTVDDMLQTLLAYALGRATTLDVDDIEEGE